MCSGVKIWERVGPKLLELEEEVVEEEPLLFAFVLLLFCCAEDELDVAAPAAVKTNCDRNDEIMASGVALVFVLLELLFCCDELLWVLLLALLLLDPLPLVAYEAMPTSEGMMFDCSKCEPCVPMVPTVLTTVESNCGLFLTTPTRVGSTEAMTSLAMSWALIPDDALLEDEDVEPPELGLEEPPEDVLVSCGPLDAFAAFIFLSSCCCHSWPSRT